jgi:hypothetical protein
MTMGDLAQEWKDAEFKKDFVNAVKNILGVQLPI